MWVPGDNWEKLAEQNTMVQNEFHSYSNINSLILKTYHDSGTIYYHIARIYNCIYYYL